MKFIASIVPLLKVISDFCMQGKEGLVHWEAKLIVANGSSCLSILVTNGEVP